MLGRAIQKSLQKAVLMVVRSLKLEISFLATCLLQPQFSLIPSYHNKRLDLRHYRENQQSESLKYKVIDF